MTDENLFRARKVLTDINRMRENKELTAERYDEIVALRMLLLDIVSDAEAYGPGGDYLIRGRHIRTIRQLSKKWGQKDDIV